MASHLTIDSTGRCFYCRNKTMSQIIQDSVGIYSLKLLSRYLKLDMRTVFLERDQVPPALLANVQDAELKVELCADCAPLTEIFSKLYQKLELLEMELLSCINHIHKKLMGAERIHKTDQSSKDASADSTENSEAILEVVEALREETMRKCSRKLGRSIPRVTARKLNLEQMTTGNPTFTDTSDSRIISSDRQDFLSETSPEHVSGVEEEQIDIGHVKMEVPNLGDLTAEDSDSGSCSPPHYDGRSEDSDRKHSTTEALDDKDVMGDRKRTLTKGKPKRKFLKIGTDKFDFNRATNTIKCKTCSEIFKRKKNFLEHYKKTHLQIRYKCTSCDKEFTQKANHKRHFESAHLKVTFKCEVCFRTFIKKETFVAHTRRNDCDPASVPKHVCHCEICGTGFAQKYNLYKHLKEVHSQPRTFECDTCGKRFNRKRNLDMHKAKARCKLEDVKTLC